MKVLAEDVPFCLGYPKVQVNITFNLDSRLQKNDIPIEGGDFRACVKIS